MAKNTGKKLQICSAENNEGFLLDEISPGFDGTIVAMVSRKWDVYKTNGSYLSTDFILSDEKSNLIHCFASHNKSYKFLAKLQEGMLFSFKGFKVHSNRGTFKKFFKGQYMLEFDGDTKVSKVTGDVGRYLRYPFQIVELEELTPTNQLVLLCLNEVMLILESRIIMDIIGYVTHVGEILTKSIGATTLEFNFTNERGRQVRVTLWGRLGTQMIKKKLENPDPYALILTAMSAKKYIGQLSVSSSSSTQLIDNDDIPVLKQFKTALSGRDLSQIPVSNAQTIPRVNTLSELLDWGRMNKADPDDKGDRVYILLAKPHNSFL
uniref:uncharacterized protein LOC122591525 n=1 Tax=Erigeron canadensis TaxID=72917 RepID=UPI001CB8BDB3|nr:uncharacterized protein LOC122591525 [Erigeron canadensis]